MDPLTAISLAGTVVQFLDFGIKLVSKTHEIYSSIEGTQTRDVDLELLTENLTSVTRRLSSRARKACAFALSEDEKALERLTQQCGSVGDELVRALQNAKVQGPFRGWKSARQALKSILGGDRVQDLYDRLKQYREQVVVVLLVITSAKQTALGDDLQKVKQTVNDAETKILDDARRARVQILDAIRRSHYRPDKPDDVATVSGLLSDMNARSANYKKQEALLSSLYYPRMHDRREYISQAHSKTFNWALEGNSDTPTAWHNLKAWLQRKGGIYWLSGKAGSGKSTLMKYIEYDPRTTLYLESWASPKPHALLLEPRDHDAEVAAGSLTVSAVRDS